MKSNLIFSFKLVTCLTLLVVLSLNFNSLARQNNDKQQKTEKPKKLTKEEKKAIKVAQAKAAVKNTKRVEKIKGQK